MSFLTKKKNTQNKVERIHGILALAWISNNQLEEHLYNRS